MFTTARLIRATTVVALALGWVDLFLPDESSPIHVALVAAPGSVAVLCAIVLGLEMLWQRWQAPGRGRSKR